jgi:hypothetical protein
VITTSSEPTRQRRALERFVELSRLWRQVSFAWVCSAFCTPLHVTKIEIMNLQELFDTKL